MTISEREWQELQNKAINEAGLAKDMVNTYVWMYVADQLKTYARRMNVARTVTRREVSIRPDGSLVEDKHGLPVKIEVCGFRKGESTWT